MCRRSGGGTCYRKGKLRRVAPLARCPRPAAAPGGSPKRSTVGSGQKRIGGTHHVPSQPSQSFSKRLQQHRPTTHPDIHLHRIVGFAGLAVLKQLGGHVHRGALHTHERIVVRGGAGCGCHAPACSLSPPARAPCPPASSSPGASSCASVEANHRTWQTGKGLAEQRGGSGRGQATCRSSAPVQSNANAARALCCGTWKSQSLTPGGCSPVNSVLSSLTECTGGRRARTQMGRRGPGREAAQQACRRVPCALQSAASRQPGCPGPPLTVAVRHRVFMQMLQPSN